MQKSEIILIPEWSLAQKQNARPLHVWIYDNRNRFTNQNSKQPVSSLLDRAGYCFELLFQGCFPFASFNHSLACASNVGDSISWQAISLILVSIIFIKPKNYGFGLIMSLRL